MLIVLQRFTQSMRIDSEMKAERTEEAEKKRLASKVSHWH